MSITSVYSYLCKWRQCQHNPHTTTRSLNRKKYIQVKVGTAGESFPYLAQYGDIIGVKFQVAQYRVTSTDSEGNTEVRDLPELELVRFTRDARQNLWQHQFSHSEQALGIPMWEVEHETVDGLVDRSRGHRRVHCCELTRDTGSARAARVVSKTVNYSIASPLMLPEQRRLLKVW